jgi:hypothetical protein
MVTANTDRTKIVSSTQTSTNNIPRQAYTPQLYTNLNPYANEVTPMHRRETTNMNGDISNRFRIYHQNIRGLKVKQMNLCSIYLQKHPT